MKNENIPDIFDDPQKLKALLAGIVEHNSLAITLMVLSMICRENAESHANPDVRPAWARAEKIVSQAHDELLK